MKVFLYFVFLVFPCLGFSDEAQTQLDEVQQLIQQENTVSANNPYPQSNDMEQINNQLGTASPDDAQTQLGETQQLIQDESSIKMPDRDTAYQQRLNEANGQINNQGQGGQNNQAANRAYINRVQNANRQIDNPNDRNSRFMSESDQSYRDRLRNANQDINHPNKRNKGALSASETAYQQRLQTAAGSIKNSDGGDDGDSCDVTMCMFGMVAGGGDASECSNAVSKFFGIKAFSGPFDSFDPVKTEIERKTFLKKCDKGVDKEIDSIISKFGQVEG